MIRTIMDNGQERSKKTDLQEIREDIRREFAELKQTIRESHMELIRVFYSYAQQNYERIAAIRPDSAVLRERLPILKSQMTEVEKRLNLPPSPQS